MDIVGIVFIIVLAGWVLFYALAFSLYLWERLDEILAYYRDKRALARARRKARALAPQPSLEDPSWLPISHDDVLLCLSQSIRAEFQTPPSTLIDSEPTGSPTLKAATAAYSEAVLQGTATINHYRRLQDAVDHGVRS